MSKSHPGFSLGELITTTANEIRAARRDVHEDPVMKFSGCTLELSVTVGAEAGGGIKFWVVDASAKANAESVSKITLSFEPLKDVVTVFSDESGDSENTEGPPSKPRNRG